MCIHVDNNPKIVIAPIGFEAKVEWKVNGYSKMDAIIIRQQHVKDVVLFIYGHGKDLTSGSFEPAGDGKETFGFIIRNTELRNAGIYQLIHEGQILANVTFHVYGKCSNYLISKVHLLLIHT